MIAETHKKWEQKAERHLLSLFSLHFRHYRDAQSSFPSKLLLMKPVKTHPKERATVWINQLNKDPQNMATAKIVAAISKKDMSTWCCCVRPTPTALPCWLLARSLWASNPIQNEAKTMVLCLSHQVGYTHDKTGASYFVQVGTANNTKITRKNADRCRIGCHWQIALYSYTSVLWQTKQVLRRITPDLLSPTPFSFIIIIII